MSGSIQAPAVRGGPRTSERADFIVNGTGVQSAGTTAGPVNDALWSGVWRTRRCPPHPGPCVKVA